MARPSAAREVTSRSARGAFVPATLFVCSVSAAFAAAVGSCASATPSAVITSSASSSSAGVGGAASAAASSGSPDAGEPDGVSFDANGYCGNQLHKVISDPPNLYFLFDISDSMNDMVSGGFTKYQLVQNSAVQMIESLGPLINFGAAVFPWVNGGSACSTGKQIFPVSPGDPVSPSTGPNTGAFIVATGVTPGGGTPTAATLRALQPDLVKIKGRTVVILATDGAPNCNAMASCTAAECIPNIEGTCGSPASCCGPSGSGGPDSCVDEGPSVAAVQALEDAKIPVVVIGIPGSDVYADVLDAMAQAGGAPQANGPPYYYAVDDLSTLTQLFQTIAQAYISCDIALTPVPATMDDTNVYFDGTVVLQDPANGWTWKSAGEITLNGAACDQLKSGMIANVQIVSGCPTEKAM